MENEIFSNLASNQVSMCLLPSLPYCLSSLQSRMAQILVGNLDFKSSSSSCAMAQEQAFHLLGSVMNDLVINTTDSLTPAPPPPSISDDEAWAILRCLAELNFRVELLALH